ncbi:MAG: M48 family metalloprotease [Acidobacteriota bacterium]
MNNQTHPSRTFGILFLLIVCLTITTLLPFSAFAQEMNQKVQPVSKNTNQPAAQTVPAAVSSKPLSVNEDPSQIGKRNINKGFTGWLGGSKDKEIAIGRQIAAEVEQQSKILDDPIVTEYVNRVGQNIALHSDVKVPVTIKVIDSDEVNAFALPGGFMFVNKGLILAADNAVR